MSEHVAKLEQALEAAGPEPTRQRVDALNALAFEVGFNDVERSALLAAEAAGTSRELGYQNGLAWGLLNGAYRDYFVASYDRAMNKGLEALDLFEASDDQLGIGNTRLGLGMIYWSLGDYELAVAHLHAANRLLQEHNATKRVPWGLTMLGGVYESIGDLDKSFECHTRALALFEELGDRVGISRALTGLGTVTQRQGKLDEALEYHFKSLGLSRESGNRTSESRARNDIGTVFLAKGELARAAEHLDKALAIRRADGNQSAAITSLLDLGRLFIEKREPREAIRILNEALSLAEETRTKPKVYRAHEIFARAYESLGDFERALEHQRKFQEIKEDVLGEESATRLKNLQIKIEAEALEQLKQAQARLIQSEKMAALGKLVAGLAHELNTPAGVISSATDVIDRGLIRLESALADDSAIETLRNIQQSRAAASDAARRLAKIVTSLKSFTRLDEAAFQLADVRDGIESTLSLLEPHWGDRIRVVRELEAVPKIEGYPTELNQALMTLLVNAGEAIEDEGTITVKTAQDNGHVRIVARDTGKGIPEDRLKTLFDVGFTDSGKRIRLRVGLANVHATIAKHKGEISVTSKLNEGTTFEIKLPIRQRG